MNTASTVVLASTKYVDVHALRNVLAFALVAGVGITVLFAVASRALSNEGPDGPSPVDRAIAGACLAAVAAAVIGGVWAVLAK